MSIRKCFLFGHLVFLAGKNSWILRSNKKNSADIKEPPLNRKTLPDATSKRRLPFNSIYVVC